MGSSDKVDKAKKGSVPKEDGQRGSSRNTVDVSSVQSGADGKASHPPVKSAPVVPSLGSQSGGSGTGPSGSSGGRGVSDGMGRRSSAPSDVSVPGLNKSLVDMMKSKPGTGSMDVPQAVTDVIDRLERTNNTLMDFIQRQRLDVTQPPAEHRVQVQPQQQRGQGFAEAGMPDDGNETDEEEFHPEGFIGDIVDSEREETDDESMEVSNKFTGNKRRHEPDPMALFLWSQARKTGPEFVEDEWKSVNQGSLIKSYTAHPVASVFAAQLADSECPDLKFKEKVDLEKQMKASQNACGAAAAATAKVLVEIPDECEKLAATAKDYRDPQIEIQDPRSEMAEVLDAIKRTMMNGMAKTLAESLKISAWQFNQLIQLRRGQFLFKITQEKNARAICKRLNPSDRYLFGERLGNVCKNLKESVQLNPLSHQFGNRTSFGYGGSGSGYSKGFRGRGGFRGKNGYRGSRGKIPNERVNRFSSGTKPRGG